MRAGRWKALAGLLPLLVCLLWAGAAAAGSADRGGAAVRPVPEPQAVTVEFMAGQMIMTGFEGPAALPGSPILRDVSAGRVGGVVLFDVDTITRGARNIVSLPQIRALTAALQAAAPYPLFIAVDQEGGQVQRIKAVHGLTAHPSHAVLGRGAPERTRMEAEAMGRELADLGCNMNLAPCVDLNVNPASPAIGRAGRSFGTDPELVARHAAAFGAGMRAAGVIPCLKHFPGHGSAAGDTHDGLVDVTRTWSTRELRPYAALFGPSGKDWPGAVLTAHVSHTGLDPAYPASLSRVATTDLLRGMGFDGVAITDDLQMEAVAGRWPLEEQVRLAVLAGADILLFGNNTRRRDPNVAARAYASLVELVRAGVVSEARLRQSWERIRRLKQGLRVPPHENRNAERLPARPR